MSKPTFFPVLLYRDPAKAIDWLCKAFGFRVRANYKDDEGQVVHAELAYGEGLVMLGPAKETLGEVGVQHVYVAVLDPDTHHDQAKAAGAEITMGLRDTDYGSRDYAAKDLEGHRWYFGTYRPGVEPVPGHPMGPG